MGGASPTRDAGGRRTSFTTLLTNEAYTGTAVWGVKSRDEKAPEPVRV